jgi:hypothetical protein
MAKKPVSKKKAPAKKPARKKEVLDQKEHEPQSQKDEPQIGEGLGEAPAEKPSDDESTPDKED